MGAVRRYNALERWVEKDTAPDLDSVPRSPGSRNATSSLRLIDPPVDVSALLRPPRPLRAASRTFAYLRNRA